MEIKGNRAFGGGIVVLYHGGDFNLNEFVKSLDNKNQIVRMIRVKDPKGIDFSFFIIQYAVNISNHYRFAFEYFPRFRFLSVDLRFVLEPVELVRLAIKKYKHFSLKIEKDPIMNDFRIRGEYFIIVD